jgi:hypothetical protein
MSEDRRIITADEKNGVRDQDGNIVGRIEQGENKFTVIIDGAGQLAGASLIVEKNL